MGRLERCSSSMRATAKLVVGILLQFITVVSSISVRAVITMVMLGLFSLLFYLVVPVSRDSAADCGVEIHVSLAMPLAGSAGAWNGGSFQCYFSFDSGVSL